MLNRWGAAARVRSPAAWRDSSIRRFSEASPEAALALAALLVAAFSTSWFLLQSPNFFSGYDFVRMHAFYKAFFRESLLAGKPPLWNPFVGLGRPFMADIETATLYPPNLLVLPFGVYGGVALMVLLHQALAVYGGVRLGRVLGAGWAASWLLGSGIAVCGPLSARLSVGIVEGYFALCWVPALLWLGARLQDGWDPKAGAAFALSVALSILAGQPPLLYVAYLGLGVFLAFRQRWPADGPDRRLAAKNLLGLLLSGLLGLGLAGAELLPFLELVGQGNRPLNAAGFALPNGMSAANWLSLLVPPSPAFDLNWEYDAYCGLVPLLAAVGGLSLWRERNVRALAAMGLAGVLLSAGDRAPFLGWVLHVLPGAGALRIPSRYGILTGISLLGLASISLTRGPRRPALVLVPALLAGAVLMAWLRPYTVDGTGAAAGYLLTRLGPLAAAALLVGLWQARERLKRSSWAVGCLLWAFCAANWIWAIALESPIYSTRGFETLEKPVHAALEARGLLGAVAVPPRIAFSPADLCENAGMTQGFSTSNSYVAPALYRTWSYVHAASGAASSAVDFINMPLESGGAAVRWDAINLAAIVDHNTRTILFKTQPDPRAYMVFDVERVADAEEANRRLVSRHGTRSRALLERGVAEGFQPAAGSFGSDAAIVAFSPERISVSTRAEAAGILVLAEAWYPGWTARVDGRPASVFPVNGWMRGTLVPAGAHAVTLEFHSRYLAAGAALSLLSAALVAALAAGWLAPGGRRQADSRIL